MTRPADPPPRQPRQPRQRTRRIGPGTLTELAVLVVLGTLLVSCGLTSTVTPLPTASVTPSAPATVPPATPPSSGAPAAPTASTGPPPSPTPTTAPPPGTTTTAWGRIWDRLPAGFPRFPGAEPANAGGGPASALLTVPATVTTASTWYRRALEQAGYHTRDVNGPLEDGSVVIDWTGATTACRIQAGFAPHGNQVIATILFAAACPFH